jgi:hypothetical protein
MYDEDLYDVIRDRSMSGDRRSVTASKALGGES